ncbi:unnamed protein product [Symbiodinium natans]|uniref:AB hydrolase-1 domain-containing protein n=1 Tax=Symbiodinium natans TaxID=878477 RepID=A0A812TJJ9_9DINO|nr:unnamed protein product [Symbiodinium natans]
MRAARLRAAASRWVETRGADLHGVSVLGSSPALVWTHGLGGSCEADELRGLDHVLDPGKLGNRTVLRFDLRGHGRSAGAHDPARGHEQYTWPELAKDLRRAAADSVSRCFYGGEALGAAVALHAAVAATSTGSVDAPPGLVLMRPPQALAQVARGVVDAAWQDQMRQLAATLEKQGFEALEAMEKADNGPLLNGAASFTEADLEQLFALRRAMGKETLAAAVRGHAESQQPDLQLIGRLKENLAKAPSTMAADAYGVPLTPGCPVLLLAVAGDAEHPVEAAEELAAALPNAELEVHNQSLH